MAISTIGVERPRIFSPDQIARMYPAALRILSECGLRVRHEELLEPARRAGMRVVGDRVYPDRSAVADLVVEDGPGEPEIGCREEDGPPTITLTVHNYPTRVHEFDTDRFVPYTTERLIEATRLVDTCAGEGVQAGAPGVPTDVPPYLATVLQFKIGCQYSRTGRIYWDAQYMRSIGYVMDMAEVVEQPIRRVPVFVNSPLCIGGESVAVALAYRDRLQSVRAENISLAGTSAPIHIAHATTLGLAEVLGTAAVMREATGLAVDWFIWVSGGSPGGLLHRWASEEVNAFYHGTQPCAEEGIITCGARMPGSEAAAEKMASLMSDGLFGTRRFLGAGNLGSDECWSPEQLMIDIEMRDYVQHLLRGLDTRFDPDVCHSETVEGLELGIFLALESTARAYRHVTWLPKLFGKEDLRQRAREAVREHLAGYDYELDPHMSRELERIYLRAQRDLGGA